MSASDDVLEFWYDHASTYSYPAAMRVEALASRRGLRVAWRPFLLGPIFEKAYTKADSPFNSNPPRGRYMWRDLERICAAASLPFRVPTVMPRNSLLAARVAIVGVDDGWVSAFSRAVFHANFAEDRDIADEGVIAAILTELGLPAREVLTRAVAPEHKPRLRAATSEAARRGIFGAPTYFRLGEMFFGGDRLAQALAWPEPRPVDG
jgi:2-hydroxychromene-2-carboxylate isomerase